MLKLVRLDRFARLGGSILNFALLALLTVFQTVGTDPRIGSWALVSAQCSLNPPDKLIVTDRNGEIHIAMFGETHLEFTAKPDGHDTAVPGNPGFDQVELRRINKRQAEVTEKKAGAVVGTIGDKLSKDGKELTITTASTGHPSQITVWTRTGGTKVFGDALAGEWTQDPSATRLRQGLVVNFAPDGSGGVRFSGDFSYSARFDGKQYDLMNSRNDTVSLQLVDPHTVDATYRRDNQVTQNDRWAVSADGQQMTLTTTARLEMGQHLTEKLVFKKQ
jgi:hypothetical protein